MENANPSSTLGSSSQEPSVTTHAKFVARINKLLQMRQTIDSILFKTMNELTNQSSNSKIFCPEERNKCFVYVVDFMILEDLNSIIDSRLSEVLLGQPFAYTSKLTYDESLGLIRFAQRDDKVVFRVPQRTKELDLVYSFKKDKFEAFFVENLKTSRKYVKGLPLLVEELVVLVHIDAVRGK
nr:protein kinase-like domain, concanavalin A-like lectin/glucanase domain protein [Tanacetum cinerariifolium]